MRKDLRLGCRAGSDSLNGKWDCGTAAVPSTGEEQERSYSTCFPAPVLGQPGLRASWALRGRLLLTGAPQHMDVWVGAWGGCSWSLPQGWFWLWCVLKCLGWWSWWCRKAASWCVDVTWLRKPELSVQTGLTISWTSQARGDLGGPLCFHFYRR